MKALVGTFNLCVIFWTFVWSSTRQHCAGIHNTGKMDNDHFRCLLCEIKQLKRTDKKSLVCCVLLHYYTPDIMCGELSRSNIYCNILMCVISSCEGSAVQPVRLSSSTLAGIIKPPLLMFYGVAEFKCNKIVARWNIPADHRFYWGINAMLHYIKADHKKYLIWKSIICSWFVWNVICMFQLKLIFSIDSCLKILNFFHF